VIDRAEQLLVRAHRDQTPVAALYLDIDGFKHVNDNFGHAAGDELLRIVADRVSGVLREADTVGRLGLRDSADDLLRDADFALYAAKGGQEPLGRVRVRHADRSPGPP
jgi:predicted signal transduction protein with EAL and GGDEF domain